ncbi:MAG: CHAT domain-containing protein [Planctomycetes bacterium]|nr:CHAT domain-containing protein [Planctomycetota bacterium]
MAYALNNVAFCLKSLGRASEALPQFEAALAMRKRLYGDRDHPDVATSLSNVAACLEDLGRASEALLHCEAALAMRKRVYGDRDHPDVATSLSNVAVFLQSLGRASAALPQHEATLAMRKRLYGDRDHPDVAASLNNVASCLWNLGRVSEALPQCEAALAMRRRLYGDRDHPDVASSLSSVAACLQSLGRGAEALASEQQAMAMIERLRGDAQVSAELRQSFFEELKRGGVFERSQILASRLGRPLDAVHAAERSRGRDLLDQLAQFGDPEVEAERRARARGDEAAANRLAALRTEVAAARTESDRLLHELTQLADLADDADRAQRREALIGRSNAVSTKLRQLLDERARLLGDVLPVGRVRDAAEIQSALQRDELLLEFTLTRDVALLYVVARAGDVQVVELPTAFATVQRILPRLLQRTSRAPLRGRQPGEHGAPAADASDAESHELFASLFPAAVWERVRAQKRVFLAAHRELHRMPFELLVTDTRDGKPVPWLDAGPPVSYVSSGTMLHWLRHRAEAAADDTTSLDLLAVGDPRRLDAEPEVPEQGVFVVAVNDGSEGARLGLQPGDVLTSYDGAALADDKALRDLRMATERAIEDGQRERQPIPIVVWRRGTTRTVEANAGPLGIDVGAGRARAAFAASLGGDAQMARITRAGDLERLGALPPLRGARDEAEAIGAVFGKRQAKVELLLGADATEPSVFDLAAKAKYLHFACHGIAEEYAGQSLSMLVLSQPQHVLPGDDGLLKLGDLLRAWRGRLASCRLVVLSACQTNIGPTLRDEAPQALPIGFLFAGAPAVISSLWPVDDASTKELMTDFYSRLLAGETDRLAAFTAAKKALRQRYPEPFHWAPFLYLGSPE